MSNLTPLKFNWKYNRIELPEIFNSRVYKRSENVFENSDYLAQANEVYCAYVYQKRVNDPLYRDIKDRLNELYNYSISLNEEMLACVECLKSAYAEIIQYNDAFFNEVRVTLKRLEKDEKIFNIKKKNYDVQFKETSRYLCCFMILQDSIEKLNDAIVEFDKTSNVNKVEQSVILLKKKIQSHADFLARRMSSIWARNLWKTIEKTKSQTVIVNLMPKLQSLVDKSKSDLNDLNAIRKGYKRYFYDEKPQSCYALCVADDEKFFALSGNDYSSSGIPPTSNKDIDAIADAIGLSLKGFTQVTLNDDTKRYATCLSSSEIYYDGRETLRKDERFASVNFIGMNYSCCERKILSKIPSTAKNISLFIRFKPCKKCLPAMVGKLNQSIESYVISEQIGYIQRFFMTKVIVKDRGYVNLNNYKVERYELNESFIVD